VALFTTIDLFTITSNHSPNPPLTAFCS